MSGPLLGVIVSAAAVVLLTLLYVYEARRKSRFLSALRLRLDYFVLTCALLMRRLTASVYSDAVRQTLHFALHAVLRAVLRAMRSGEVRISRLLRSNRALAKRVRTERKTRTMLDEITDHKAATALSEREKQKRKEESINGTP